MAGVDERDGFPEPVTLFIGEVRKKGEEVEIVVGTRLLGPCIGLVEEEDLRDQRGQAPGGLLDTSAKRHREAGLAAEDPSAAGALVDLNVEAEALLRGRIEAVREAMARVGRAGVDVGGENQGATVPWFGRIAGDGRVVRDELPAGEMLEEGAQVVLKDGDIDVAVIAGLAGEPGVDRPAAAEGPPGTEVGHEVRDTRDGFWDGCHRLAVGSFNHVFASVVIPSPSGRG